MSDVELQASKVSLDIWQRPEKKKCMKMRESHCIARNKDKSNVQRYVLAITLQWLSQVISILVLSNTAILLMVNLLLLVTLICLSLLIYQYFSHMKLHHSVLSSYWKALVFAFVLFAFLWAYWKIMKICLMSDVVFAWKSLWLIDCSNS